MEKEKIVVEVNGNKFPAFVDKDLIELDGKNYQVEILKENAPGVYSLKINDQVVIVEVQRNEDGSFTIVKDGLVYETDVVTETVELLRKFAVETDSKHLGEVSVKAPMPGLVVKVLVSEGDVVKRGDKVVILEAMKMENALSSPISGIVKKVFAMEGKTVEKDAILVEISSQ
jgi:biotin carboxyl carrier protein